ncbi:MAG: EamA family transporter [Sphingobacteriales bacterium]|nr:EamA family transporter [Sphingobacteriales bacterium]
MILLKLKTHKYILAAIVSTLMWGFFSIPLRNLQHYPSDQILLYRIYSSLIFTWIIMLLFRRKQMKADLLFIKALSGIKKRNLYLLVMAAGFLITGNWFSFIYAVNHINLQSAAFAYMVCPLITAFGGFLILKEDLSRLKMMAMCIALISVFLLGKGSINHLLWSIFIATLYAFYLIIQRVVTNLDKFNMLGIQLVISSLLSFPLYFFNHYVFVTDVYFWINIVIISIVFTIVPLFLSLYALIGIPSSTLGIIIYLNPIVSFAVAFLYFNESISLYQIGAYTLLLFAVIVFNWNMIYSFSKRFSKPITAN